MENMRIPGLWPLCVFVVLAHALPDGNVAAILNMCWTIRGPALLRFFSGCSGRCGCTFHHGVMLYTVVLARAVQYPSAWCRHDAGQSDTALQMCMFGQC